MSEQTDSPQLHPVPAENVHLPSWHAGARSCPHGLLGAERNSVRRVDISCVPGEGCSELLPSLLELSSTAVIESLRLEETPKSINPTPACPLNHIQNHLLDMIRRAHSFCLRTS